MDATLTASGPRTVLGWLPVAWSRWLFPGAAPADAGPIRPWVLAALLLIPGVLLYPSLGHPLFEPDETRYAQLPREMLQRGDPIVPHLQNEPYLDKPPLFYWLVMLSYSLFGVTPASARLVPALAVHGCVLLTYLFGRRWLGERPARAGALLLALAPGFTGMGRLLILDGLLTFLMTLALCCAYEAIRGPSLRRGWWLAAALACGLGVLTKGPVALVLLAVPLWLQRWLSPSAPLRRRDWAVFLGIVAAVALPWYIAVCLRQPEFVRYFLWEHNVQRFLNPFDHPRGVWFYVPIVLAGLLPATLWLWPGVRFLIATESADRRPAALGFVLLAAGWCLLFFTLSGCKLPTYILPAFPPLALALGFVLDRLGRLDSASFRVALVVVAVFLLAVHHLLVPWYAEFRSPVRRPEPLAAHVGDPDATVVCYPRPCHAVAYTFDRADLPNYRSKDIEELRRLVRTQRRTVILCTHRHSLNGLRQLLPPEVRIVHTEHFGLPDVPGLPQRWQGRAGDWLGQTALGLCDLAVVECDHSAEAGLPSSSRGNETGEASEAGATGAVRRPSQASNRPDR